jgi:hypothetical protein
MNLLEAIARFGAAQAAVKVAAAGRLSLFWLVELKR